VIGIRRNTENRVRPPAPVTVRDLTFGLPMTITVQQPLDWLGSQLRSSCSVGTA
jgi:hypothetical protein